ncbi:hypothetical protein CI105_06475 [Candidatus Izimaplasma bacterium ZiA1]|uniref:DNA polymerase III subunit alpha n=1 Tax=Candidatus Izimoplasma sp. ZiA1 TaxID=2024899 RepID=UPI000BAA7AB4|nr:hypothetical protein CI105_06475 [Candidatus Izimaplasma bacterium ZiA1]
MNYINLYNETHYSMNGSLLKIEDLIDYAVLKKNSFLAITDNKLHGAIKFYKACIKNNIKPLIGINTKVVFNEMTIKILVYPLNYQGYLNLLSISSINGVSGEFIVENNYNLFTDNIIIVDDNKLDDEILIKLYEVLSKSTPHLYLAYSNQRNQYKPYEPIAFLKTRYIVDEDIEYSKTLEKILANQTDSLFSKNLFNSLSSLDGYFQTINNQEAISNSLKIANLINLQINLGEVFLPKAILPKKGVSSKEYLDALAYKGLELRIKNKKVNKREYLNRLKYELDIIDEMGYNDYFLIVYDFVKYAKNKGYLVGPGRGSAAASLVSYCLGITSVDSIEYELVFERFLNPQRVTMPDIDLDFPDDKRDEIIEYVRDKYGNDKVATICTFGTFKSKSCLRDTARVENVSQVMLDEVLKENKNYATIKEMVENSKYINNIITVDKNAAKFILSAKKIEGLARHIGTHAAGIILTQNKMTEYTPVQAGLLDMIQTQYEQSDLEELGLLKIDFLGLRNLTIIDKTLKLLKKYEKITINIYDVPLDDKLTYKLLRETNTTGVFQLESPGMRNLLRQMEVNCFEDIVTALALFRPGPMENIPEYLNVRNKTKEITYLNKVLEETLKKTNGIIIYQEQILTILNKYAGYSLGEADVVRRAVSKKKRDILDQERARFLMKSKVLKREEKEANEIYDYIVKFANYGFNRAHSVAYAYVSYWTAYLKANFPKYYLSVLISSVLGSEKQTKDYIFEANKLKIRVKSPNINTSAYNVIVYKDELLFPLLGIKNVGLSTVKKIIEERSKNKFKSYIDFISRTHSFLNKRIYEALIAVGALDEFNLTKKVMIEKLEEAINFSTYGNYIKNEDFVIENITEYSIDELIELEKTALGFNLSIHHLRKFDEYINTHQLQKVSDIDESYTKKPPFRIIGVLSLVKVITTKNDKKMAFVEIEDEFMKLSGVIFTDTYQELKDLLILNNVYLFQIRVELRGENLQLVVMKAHNLTLS